jgi:putative ABC transport system ATP-binding protein
MPLTAINDRQAAAAQAVNLSRIYGTGPTEVQALAGVSVTFERGQFIGVMGPSGSGKSTLMHCMAGLDRPTSGQAFIGGVDVSTLDDRRLSELRRDRVGFVFQSFNLVSTLNAAENISLPADLAGKKVDKGWFDYLVGQLGLASRLTHRPSEMSGGQQQRVACARAMMLSFLRASVTDLGQSIVMVTHDPRSAAYADRVFFLADGKVVDQLDAPTADSVFERMRILGA